MTKNDTIYKRQTPHFVQNIVGLRLPVYAYSGYNMSTLLQQKNGPCQCANIDATLTQPLPPQRRAEIDSIRPALKSAQVFLLNTRIGGHKMDKTELSSFWGWVEEALGISVPGDGRVMYRDWEQLLDDQLWVGDYFPNPPGSIEFSVRKMCAALVMCCMPADDFAILKGACDDFIWFIPDPQELGVIMPFRATHFPEPDTVTGMQLVEWSRVLYLNPALEMKHKAYMSIAVSAHEIAHIVLDHDAYRSDTYDQDEEDSWQRVRDWGFEKEAKGWSRYRKSQTTREANYGK